MPKCQRYWFVALALLFVATTTSPAREDQPGRDPVELVSENSRLRVISASALDQLVARTNELSASKELIAVQKRLIESQQQAIDSQKKLNAALQQKAEESSKEGLEADRDLEAFTDFWESMAKITHRDGKIVARRYRAGREIEQRQTLRRSFGERAKALKALEFRLKFTPPPIGPAVPKKIEPILPVWPEIRITRRL